MLSSTRPADRLRRLRNGGRPWTVAGVAIAALGIMLLMRGLAARPDADPLPGYAAVYALVGLCMFGPCIRAVSLGKLLGFVLPGLAMVVLWMLNAGFWGGLWLMCLPAWAIFCLRWSSYGRRQQAGKLALFALAVPLAGLVFIASVFLPNVSAFLLPLVPLVRFAISPAYRQQPLQAVTEFLLSCALIAVAVTQPSTDWGWPPGYAGAAVLTGLLLTVWAGRSHSGRKRGSPSRVDPHHG